jgi:hypothetical protein
MTQRKSSIPSESINIELLNRPPASSFRKSETNTKPTMNSYQTLHRPTNELDVKQFRNSDFDNCT